MVVKCQPCCTHVCGKILNPTDLPEWVVSRRYLKTIKAPREIGFGPRRLKAVPRKESVLRFPRRGAPVQDTFGTFALENRRQEIPRKCMLVHAFAAVTPFDKYRVLGIQLPSGNVLWWIGHERRQETYSFGVVPSVSCPGSKLRFLPSKYETGVCLKAKCRDRGRL